MHKTRSKPQPSPEFQPNVEFMSTDESATLMEVKQMLGTLTTTLATMATQVEHLSQGNASQVTKMSAQPRTRAGDNPPTISMQVARMSAQLGTRAGGNPEATPTQMVFVSAQPGTRAKHHSHCQCLLGATHPGYGRAPGKHGTHTRISHH